MIRPPPGEVGMVLEDGAADWMTRDAPSRDGGPENGFVGFFGDGRCDLDSEPEVGFVFHHVSVEGFPEAQEDGPVQMASVAAQLQDGHIPLLHVGVCLCLVVLQMKGSNFGEDVDRRTVGQQPWPAFELPGRTLYEHGHHSIPVLRSQFERLIDDTIRHSDTQRRAARLDLVFAPLKQDLVVALEALFLLLL